MKKLFSILICIIVCYACSFTNDENPVVDVKKEKVRTLLQAYDMPYHQLENISDAALDTLNLENLEHRLKAWKELKADLKKQSLTSEEEEVINQMFAEFEKASSIEERNKIKDKYQSRVDSMKKNQLLRIRNPKTKN